MNAIEHLEHVIGLIGKATDAEIKGKLIAIRDEVAGHVAAAQEQSKLAAEYAKKDEEFLKMKAEIARRDSEDAIGFSGNPAFSHKLPPNG